MKRTLLGLLSAGVLLATAPAVHADPSGIRYDARTHTYTNAGSRPATASAPAATPARSATADPDFVEYTLSPSRATTAPAPVVSAPVVSAPVVTASAPTVAAPGGFSAYPTLGTPYSIGYGGYGGYYGGAFYGTPGYLPYGCGPYLGYGYCGGYPYRGAGGYGYFNRLPSVTNMWIPGMGTVQNIQIPGFGYGGWGWGGGFAPCTYGAATVRVNFRPR